MGILGNEFADLSAEEAHASDREPTMIISPQDRRSDVMSYCMALRKID